jgi:hypothetical protein
MTERTREYNVTEEELEDALTRHCPQCTEIIQKVIQYRLQKMEIEDKYMKMRERVSSIISILDLPKDASFDDIKSALEDLMQMKKTIEG